MKTLGDHLEPTSNFTRIGSFLIYNIENDGVFIEHDSGEGMELSQDMISELEQIIEKFYNDNF